MRKLDTDYWILYTIPMIKKISLIFFLLTVGFLLFATCSQALELQSPRFKIEMDEVDIDAKKETDTVVYTVQSLFGPEGYREFKKYGYTINKRSEQALTFSLSQSLIVFTDVNNGKLIQDQTGFSTSATDQQTADVKLIQEYPLKNFSGDTLILKYSDRYGGYFRQPPNQNTGAPPVSVYSAKSTGSGKLIFNIDTPPHNIEGTFETIINFIATPGYE